MYKPRRTTEFHEDAREDGSILKKRQTRSQLRATITPMKKSGHWQPQSRLTQFSPSCNSKRSVANGSVSSATPLRKASSAERAVVLHKDKKWVQEQSQLIAECLDEMMLCHPLQGFPSEFFSRGAGSLRQMTMKQFVAIVNYFLQFIFGNRVNVGNNHVDEITNALHKLKYPFQVNKSWLMTPTTQHSFGHVIVVLDFLKDLALPSYSKQQDLGQYDEFPFMETTEQPSYMQSCLDPTLVSNLHMSNVVLTEEINHMLFPSAAESFGVWDTQNWDEYTILKLNVSDQIIKSLCDLPDTQSLDVDLGRLENEIEALNVQLQLPVDNKRDQLKQLKSQEQQLGVELITIQRNRTEDIDQIKELNFLSKENADRITAQRKEIQKLQSEVEGQTYKSDHFQRMKMQLSDLRNEEQFYKRQRQDLTEHGNNQQVRMSRAKKHLLDRVKKFNSHAQNIGLDSDICSASDKETMELILPLPPQYSDIQTRSQRLAKLAASLVHGRTLHEEKCWQLEQNKAALTISIEKLHASLKKINTQIEFYVLQIEKLPLTYRARNSNTSQHLQKLVGNNFKLSSVLDHLKRQHDELNQLLQIKRQQNNDLLGAIEDIQKKRLCTQTEFVMQYNEVLTQAEEQLNILQTNITENAIKLASFKLDLPGLKFSIFANELHAVHN